MMENNPQEPRKIVDELLTTLAAYETESIDLHEMCFKVEVALERLQELFPQADVSEAVNSAYLLEDINAAVLSESRPINPGELEAVREQLRRLKVAVANFSGSVG